MKEKFTVTAEIELDNGQTITKQYQIRALNEENAQNKALLKLQSEVKGVETEDKYLGLVHKTPWWHFWRLRNIERGVCSTFRYGDHKAGDLLTGIFNDIKNRVSHLKDNASHEWALDDLKRFKTNCTVAIIMNIFLFIMGSVLIIKYFTGSNNHHLFTFVNINLIIGIPLIVLSILTMIKGVLDFKTINKLISEKAQ